MSLQPLKRRIKNFAFSEQIEVEGVYHGEPLVSIFHKNGSRSFTFSMTPDQAREMAEALMDSAYEIEKLMEYEQSQVMHDD